MAFPLGSVNKRLYRKIRPKRSRYTIFLFLFEQIDDGSVVFRLRFIGLMKKRWETQTLRAGCSIKAEPKNFVPPQTHFPGARDGQNLISWRWSLPSPTNPVWWGSMQAISSYRGNRPTNTQTHSARPPARPLQIRTQTGPITIHCV